MTAHLLGEWVTAEGAAGRNGRRWSGAVTLEFYVQTRRRPAADAYLHGADMRILEPQFRRVLRMAADGEVGPEVLIVMHWGHLAARQRPGRFTAPVYDEMAAALTAALSEHGAPRAVVAEVAGHLGRARSSVLDPSIGEVHPYLRPRPGQREMDRILERFIADRRRA